MDEKEKGNEVRHTPGPWTADHRDIFSESVGVYVAIAHFNFLPEICEANARLISAAPDLLAALENARELINVARKYFPSSIKNHDKFQMENTNAAINAAIRKARGE